ncbi:MAG: ABC transporter ATP-binding protein [Dongiaceae bacterium]
MIAAGGNGAGFIEIEQVSVHFPVRRSLVDLAGRKPRQWVRAIDGVSLQIGERETLGLVGESGSGKTTLARALVRIYQPTAGAIRLAGRPLASYPVLGDDGLCRRIQMVFQDPYSSLNPRKTVGAALAEVLRFHRLCAPAEIPAEIARLLREVGLSDNVAERLPRTLSGGQRQRVGLARALAVKPDFIVLDEPVAALDVSIQAQILNLLKDLKDQAGVGMLLVAHELSVVRHMSDRVAVMYLGRIVEIGRTAEIFERPHHPYTQSLLKAVPRLVPERRHRAAVLKGDIPSPLKIPSGCRFHPRCPKATELCRRQDPAEIEVAPGHLAACHYPG